MPPLVHGLWGVYPRSFLQLYATSTAQASKLGEVAARDEAEYNKIVEGHDANVHWSAKLRKLTNIVTMAQTLGRDFHWQK